MIIHSPIISGSLTFADGATFTMPDNGVYSGSFSGSIAGIGDPETFSASVDTRIDQLTIDTGSQDSRLSSLEGFTSSIDTTIKTKLDADVVISGSSQVEFNDINNNPFQDGVSSVSVSKSIVPSTSEITLGTSGNPFKDLYLSSASLYIDGQQVLSSNTTELILTTDVNQSLKLLETGADTITLQSQNGDITLTTTGTGNIELNATIQVGAGNQILSSDGNAIQFGEDINIQGNITVTGTVDGIDVAALKDTVDAILSGSSADKDSFAEIVSLINSVDTTNDQAFASFYTSSNQRMGSLESFTSSIDSTIKTKLNSDGIISSSNQITITESQISDLDHFTIADLPAGTVSGSSQVILSDVTGYGDLATTYEEKSSGTHTLVSGSSQIDITQTQGFVSIALEYEEKSSATHTLVSGSSQVSYPGLSNIPGGIVSSSAQVDYNSIANQPTIGNGTMTVTAGAGLTGGGSFTANQTGNSSVTLNVAGGIVSGSSQIIGILSSLNTYTGSVVQPHISNTSNPHSVTKSQVGLGNVENTALSTWAGTSNITTLGTVTSGDVKAILPAGTISGSEQIDYAYIGLAFHPLASGTNVVVSGSSQITVQDTTGYGTISAHISNTSNPHSVTAAQVGLGNVTNESKATMFTNPTFTGTVIAPTPSSNDNSTKVATTAYVQQELTDLIGGAPAAYDTLLEISASIANGDSDVVALTQVVAGKLQKDQNLSDLTNAGTARTNLGLGSLATLSSVGAAQITDNSVGAAELNVSGNGTTSQYLRSDGDGSFSWVTPPNDNTTYTAGTGLSLTGTTFALDGTGTVGAATYGSTANGTKIDTITVDAYGRVTAVATGATGTVTSVATGNGLTGGTITSSGTLSMSGNYTGDFAVTGNITATADVVAYSSSDKRLKDNIQNIENPIEKVQQLNGVTWDWNENADEVQKSLPNVGVIAQEVEQVLPQLVKDRENGFKGVDYGKLTGLLIEAIKEQQKQIDDLKSKLG